MIVLDPGHKYELNHLDGNKKEILTFVKREGNKYPGNYSHYEGTNIQEVMRALIDRIKYVDNQVSDKRNKIILNNLRYSIFLLEQRAADKHGRNLKINSQYKIEEVETCSVCGHIECIEHGKNK